ncbi:MAG TPA: hypothetical protein VFE37_03090 [Chloroflexota bacterium]|nr:hypothetical protein [Chloroflexota bacterium]
MSAPHVAAPAKPRAAGHPATLAAVLVPYACARGWDGPTLARQLGCPLPALSRLLLCLPPRAEAFDRDVAKIASYVGISAATLASLLERAMAG